MDAYSENLIMIPPLSFNQKTPDSKEKCLKTVYPVLITNKASFLRYPYWRNDKIEIGRQNQTMPVEHTLGHHDR